MGRLKQETVTVQPIKGHLEKSKKKKQILQGTLRKICIVEHICPDQKNCQLTNTP